jgi:hypothetical protein
MRDESYQFHSRGTTPVSTILWTLYQLQKLLPVTTIAASQITGDETRRPYLAIAVQCALKNDFRLFELPRLSPSRVRCQSQLKPTRFSLSFDYIF